MSAHKLIITLSLLAIIFTTLFVNITPASAEAKKCTTAGNCPLTAENFNDKINADNTLEDMIHGTMCKLAGGSNLEKCLASQNGKLALFDRLPDGGAIGGVTNLTVAMYNPPVSSVEYLASLGESIGLSPKPAYAQSVSGSGNGIIKPILKIWTVTRNIAYLAFIVIFIVVGVMVMLRQKISQQTVVSIQQALPGLIIGLILVTFSYFLAALLVDIAFVSMRVVAYIFDQAGSNAFGNSGQMIQMANDSSVFQLFSTTTGGVWDSRDSLQATISNFTSSSTIKPLAQLIPVIVGTIAGLLIAGPWGLLGGLVGGAIGSAASGGTDWIYSQILSLILIIALFVQMFRLLFQLIGAYLQILINTIMGPFFILSSSLPGRGGGINNWIKAILANTLIFPAVFAMFLFAGLILGTAPGDWTVTPPLFGGMSADLLRVILAYGIILATPKIPDVIRQAFKVQGQEGLAGAAIGGFMGGYGIGSFAATQGYQRFWRGGAKPNEPARGPIAAPIRAAWRGATGRGRAATGQGGPSTTP